jgi:hypothetical protein
LEKVGGTGREQDDTRLRQARSSTDNDHHDAGDIDLSNGYQQAFIDACFSEGIDPRLPTMMAAKRKRIDIPAILGVPQVEANDPVTVQQALALQQVVVSNWLDALPDADLQKLHDELNASRTTGNIDWLVCVCCKYVDEIKNLEAAEERLKIAKMWVMSQFKKGYTQMMDAHGGGTAKFIGLLASALAVRADRRQRMEG